MTGRSTRLAVVVAALLTALVALGLAPGPLAVGAEEHLRTAPGYRSAVATAAGPTSAQVAWLAEGTVPGAGSPWQDMSRWALLDLKAFQAPNGAVAAGPGGPWSHFWPRDGSFAAVAFAVTGHTAEAAQVLDRLARLQLEPGVGFQARYALDGSPLTDRPPQSDGCGWVLWAIARARAADPRAIPASAAQLRDRCVRTLTGLVDEGRRLPAASPDYWEVSVDQATLGTSAPILAGLLAAAHDYAAGGDERSAVAVAATAARLVAVVGRGFGPAYERFGDHGGLDAAVTMLQPPFVAPEALPAAMRGEVNAARVQYQRRATQPAGGVSPGTDWVKQDGSSWTPETALLAVTAAATGQGNEAAKWLDWLEAHRTAYGSLPEKVTRSGRPAGPAPLSWTAALVLLTLDELDHGDAG